MYPKSSQSSERGGNNTIGNHKIEFYEPQIIEGKRVLATLDGRNSFPFGTKEEQEKTISLFAKASQSSNEVI